MTEEPADDMTDAPTDDLPPLAPPHEEEGAAGDMAEGAEAEGGQHGIFEMLRSTEPPVNPQEIGQELDIRAEWWEHLGCFFIKASGSRGTEAWMHLPAAAIILYKDMQEGQDDTGGAGRGAEHEEYHEADAGEPDDTLGGGEGMDINEIF